MAEDDIYGNKRKYELFLERIERITEQSTRVKYYCKNPANVKYFRKLIPYFEAKDLSYIRRYRVLYFLTLITYVLEKTSQSAIGMILISWLPIHTKRIRPLVVKVMRLKK